LTVDGQESLLVGTMDSIDALRLAIVVDEAHAGQRLDAILMARAGLSSRTVKRLAGEGRVRVDGRALLAGAPRLDAGRLVEVLDDLACPAQLAERWPLKILHEDERLLVVDKPANMATCPGPGRPAGTLANALRGLGRPLSTLEGPLRPGIVHRLDAGTSGALLVAKDDETHRRLVALFAAHDVARRYTALVEGTPAWEERLVDAPLGRKRPGRRARGVRADGQAARTRLRVRERLGSLTLLDAEPETGRTHQIRVHLASLGLPLLGDTLYGGGDAAARRAARWGLRRPALHSASLACAALGLEVLAPLPADLAGAIELLRRGLQVSGYGPREEDRNGPLPEA
jgi:23S rRNA pseudouridine1911/1915/1917 synthase